MAKAKKEERWVIDYEHTDVVKLRANATKDCTQSASFTSRDDALKALKLDILKGKERAQRDLEFAAKELKFFELASAKVESLEVVATPEVVIHE